MSALRVLLLHPATAVWLALVAATVLSWRMGTGTVGEARYVTAALLVVALLKVRFVMRYFMEVRAAGRVLRLLCDAWVVVVAVVLLTLYWQGL